MSIYNHASAIVVVIVIVIVIVIVVTIIIVFVVVVFAVEICEVRTNTCVVPLKELAHVVEKPYVECRNVTRESVELYATLTLLLESDDDVMRRGREWG